MTVSCLNIFRKIPDPEDYLFFYVYSFMFCSYVYSPFSDFINIYKVNFKYDLFISMDTQLFSAHLSKSPSFLLWKSSSNLWKNKFVLPSVGLFLGFMSCYIGRCAYLYLFCSVLLGQELNYTFIQFGKNWHIYYNETSNLRTEHIFPLF